MKEMDDLEGELRRLPTPMPPAALVQRVRRLAHLELAGRADEKLNRLVLAFLLVFSWTLTLLGLAAVRVASAGTLSILGQAAAPGSPWSWGLAYFAAVWVSGVTLFTILGIHRQRGRRNA